MMENHILRVSETSSTNDMLRSLALAGAPDGQVVIASAQSAGRGRQGKSFSSPPGTGLYLSLLHRPQSEDFAPGAVTACAAVAVSRAIREVCGLRPGIKWVNDLVLEGRKLCGILVEAVSTPLGLALVIGIGINVNTAPSDFPPELRDTAGSLFTLTGKQTDIDALAQAVIGQLSLLLTASPDAFREEYRSRCVTLGREVLVVQGAKSFAAFAETVNDDFELIVRRPDGVRETVAFGEVSVRGMCGYV